MKRITAIVAILLCGTIASAQNKPVKPCTMDPVYRQFDFWIGDWEVFGVSGKQAGESHIELILDSCIIMENWTGVGGAYTGKSFNSYNSGIKKWQQNWVDDKGGQNDYFGTYADKKMTIQTVPFLFSKDTMAIRKMTYFNLSSDKVRQLGEISKDNGVTWAVEYDLEYRRKRK